MNRTYRRHPDVVGRQIAGETFLVPIRGDLETMESVFVLDSPVAQCIWQRLEAETTGQDLCEQVVARFDTSRGQAEADVREFVAELLAAGLIVEAS